MYYTQCDASRLPFRQIMGKDVRRHRVCIDNQGDKADSGA